VSLPDGISFRPTAVNSRLVISVTVTVHVLKKTLLLLKVLQCKFNANLLPLQLLLMNVRLPTALEADHMCISSVSEQLLIQETVSRECADQKLIVLTNHQAESWEYTWPQVQMPENAKTYTFPFGLQF